MAEAEQETQHLALQSMLHCITGPHAHRDMTGHVRMMFLSALLQAYGGG